MNTILILLAAAFIKATDSMTSLALWIAHNLVGTRAWPIIYRCIKFLKRKWRIFVSGAVAVHLLTLTGC